MIPEVMRDAAHVVLEVPFVIVEVWVAAAGSRREQDVEPALARKEADPRVDRTIRDALDPERPLEVTQKRPSKDQHLQFERVAFHRRLLEAATSAHDGGARSRQR
jgi:hypothetical protein